MKYGKLLLTTRTWALKHAIEHLLDVSVRKIEMCLSPRRDAVAIRATFCDGLPAKTWVVSSSSIANSGVSSISGASPKQLSVLLEEVKFRSWPPLGGSILSH